MTPVGVDRVRITLLNGELHHNGERCAFYVAKHGVRVGCNFITMEAVEFIMKKLNERLPPDWDPCI